MDAAIQYVQSEFDKTDRNLKPDPGCATARHLNRAEYTKRPFPRRAYEIHFGLQGERASDGKPVRLSFFMDGKLSKPSPLRGLVCFDPYSEEQIRLFLPEGDRSKLAIP